MPKAKRFTAEQLEIQISQVIDNLMDDMTNSPYQVRSNIKVSDIAIQFNVDVATLRRWCIGLLGLSPRDYLARYRLDKAKTLLIQGTKPAKVAEALGFAEHKVFSTLFKRHVGVRPSDILRQI